MLSVTLFHNIYWKSCEYFWKNISFEALWFSMHALLSHQAGK